MGLKVDPSGNEVRALSAAAAWRGRRVIEIGCGDGRLTRRLASLGPALIEAIEPDAASIRRARRQLPEAEKGRIKYHVGHAGALKYPPGTFDIAVLSWVL